MSSKASRRESLRRSRLLGGALVTLMCVPAIAGPQGERVVEGRAKFKRVGNRTVIRAADGTIINYSNFDIGVNERVRFIQPGSDARVLNRIRSNEPTRIDGMLRSNGQVYLVNRAGVLFGSDSIINVGALHAAAGNITNRDFLSGIDRFTLTGDLTNMGTITGDHVMLAGRTVSNLGTIVANEGFVAMIAGDQVLVGERDGHMFAKIDSNRVEALDYAARISGVTNAGAILATDGQVIVGAGDFYGIVTHTSTNIVTHNLVIESGDGGITRVAGNIDVSGMANGRDVGGSARILGDRVAVDNATINAAGALGGGEILIGGELQGSGPIRNAKRTFVGSNAVLDASAIDNGDGGRIIVWADELTGFAGDLIATGGEFGGDGGFGEISGKHGLIFQGSVDLFASDGRQGTILFDPDNINIIDGAGGADDGELADNQILGPDGGAVTFQISEQALEALVGSVILQANINITVADLTDNVLGFQATGGQSVEITADFDGNGTGTFSMAGGDTLQTQGGDFNLSGADISLGGSSIVTNGGDVVATSSGPLTLGTVTTAGGLVSALADSNASGAGTLTLSGAVTTAGGAARFGGADWSVTGTVDSGAGGMSFDVTTAKAVGLGLPGGTALNAAELGRLTTSGLFEVGTGQLGAATPTTITVDDFDLVGTSTITGDVSLLGTGTTTFSTGASTFGGMLDLDAGDFDLQVGVTATGIGFDRSAGGTFGLGATAGSATLSVAELALITASTFDLNSAAVTAITLNAAALPNVSGQVTLNAGGVAGQVTFQTATSVFQGGLSVQANTGITIGAGVTSNGSTTFDAGGNITDVTGSVTVDSQGGLLNFLDAVTLDIGVSPTFVGSGVQMASTLTGDTGAESATFDAGVGSLSVVGAATGLTNLTITNAGITSFGGGLTIGGTLSTTNPLTGAFDSTGGAVSAGTIDLNGTSFAFGALTSTVGGITITNSAQADFGGNVLAATAFSQDGAGNAQFSGGGAQTVAAGTLVNVDGAANLALNTNATFTGTSIDFAQTLGGVSGENVTFNAGAGALGVAGAVTNLNNVTITNAGATTFGGGLTIGGTLSTTNPLTGLFTSTGGAVSAGTIDLNGTSFAFGALTSTVGGITITNSAQADFGGNALAATAFSQDGAGNAQFSGGGAQTVAAGTLVNIDGAANLALNTNATFTGTSIDFAQTLGGVSGENVTFNSGAGALGVAGAVTNLNNVTITNAGATTFGGGLTIGGTLSTTNPLTGLFTSTGGAVSAGTIDLDGTTFSFGALTSTVGGITITNSAQADFGGNVSAATAFSQDGAGNAQLSGGGAQTVAAGTLVNIDGAANLALNTNATFTGTSIDFAQTLGGVSGENVTFSAGAGALGVAGAVTNLNNVTITNAGATTFGGGLTIGGTLSTTNPLTGLFTSTGGAVSAGTIDLDGTSFSFGALTSTVGGITITNSGLADFGGNVLAATAFSQDGAGNAQFSGGGAQTVAAGTLVNIDGAANLALNTNATFTGTSIDFAQTLGGVSGENVTFNSGAGALGVAGAVTNLNNVTITNAGATTFGGGLTIGGTLSTTNPLTGLFTSAGAINGGTVDLDGAAFGFQAITTTVGGLTLTNTGTADLFGDINLAGNLTQDGAGVVRIDGDINSNNSAISFSSLSVLIQGVDIGTSQRLIDAGTGGITFANALDTQGNDTVLQGDAIDFNGGANSVDSSGIAGELIIRPSTAATDIDLGLIPLGFEGTGLMLSRNDLEAIGSNFSLIQFGFSGGTHTVRAGLMDDSLAIDSRMMAATTIIGSEIRLFDAIAGADDASFTFMGDVVVAEGSSASISTIAVNQFGGNPDAGDLIFTGTVGGTTGGVGETLTLNAIRDVDFQGAVSGDGLGAQDATGLTDLSFLNADDVSFLNSLAISGLLSSDSGSRMTGLFLTSVLGSTAGSVDLTGTGFILNTLSTTSAGVTIDNSSSLAVIGDLTSMGAFTQTDVLGTGSVSFVADLDTTGAGALTGGNASFASAVTVGGNGPRLFNLGDGTLAVANRFEASFSAGNPDPTVVFTANGYSFTGDIGLGGVFTSSGADDATLIFRPSDVSSSIDIGGGLLGAPGDMVFGQSELARIDGTFASVHFGYETTGAHFMRIGDASGASRFQSDTVFHAPGGSIAVSGPVAGDGSLTFDVGSPTSLGGDIFTDGGDVVFGDGIILTADSRVETQDNAGDDETPGVIRVNGTIEGDGNGPWSLDLLAFEDDSTNGAILGSSGLIVVTDVIGSTNPLNNLLIHGNDVALRGIGDVPNGGNGEGVLGTTQLFAQDDLILRGGTYTTRTATYAAGDEIRPTEDTVFEVFNGTGTSTLAFSLITDGMVGGDDDTFRGIRLENGSSFTARTRGGDITIDSGFARFGDGFADVLIDGDTGNALSGTSGSVTVGGLIGFNGDLISLIDAATLLPGGPVGSVDIRGRSVTVVGARSVRAQTYAAAPGGTLDIRGSFDALADTMSPITFDGTTILSGDTSVTTAGADGDDVLFTGTVDGGFALGVVAVKDDVTGVGQGDVEFALLVGGSNPLGSLSVSGFDVSMNGIGTLVTPGVLGDSSVLALGDLSLAGGLYNANAMAFMGDGDILVASISGDASFFSNGGDIEFSTATGLDIPSVTIDPGSQLFIDTRADRTVGDSVGGDALIQANIRATIGDGDAPVDLISIHAGTGRVLLSAVGGTNVTLDRAIGELRVTGDEIDLGGTIVVDLLTLQQATLGRDIAIGGATDDAGRLDLLTAEIANISDGTTLITIGNVDGTGTITFNEIEFFDPMVARLGDGGAGRIVVAGQITGSDDASITFRGAGTTTELGAGIDTDNNQIIIENNVVVGAAGIELATNGGDPDAEAIIQLRGTLDSTPGNSFDLTLDASVKGGGVVASNSGNTRIDGQIGGTDALSALTILGNDNAINGSIGTANAAGIAGVLSMEAAHANTLNAPVFNAGGFTLMTVDSTDAVDPHTLLTLPVGDPLMRFIVGTDEFMVSGSELRIRDGIDVSILSASRVTFGGGIGVDLSAGSAADVRDTDIAIDAVGSRVVFGGDVGDPNGSDRPGTLMIDANAIELMGDIFLGIAGLAGGGDALVINADVLGNGGDSDLIIEVGNTLIGSEARSGNLIIDGDVGTVGRDVDGNLDATLADAIGEFGVDLASSATITGEVAATRVRFERLEQATFGGLVQASESGVSFLGGGVSYGGGIDATVGANGVIGSDLAVEITAPTVSIFDILRTSDKGDVQILVSGTSDVSGLTFAGIGAAPFVFDLGGDFTQAGAGVVRIGATELDTRKDSATFAGTVLLTFGDAFRFLTEDFTLATGGSINSGVGLSHDLTFRGVGRGARDSIIDLNGTVGDAGNLRSLLFEGAGSSFVNLSSALRTIGSATFDSQTIVDGQARLDASENALFLRSLDVDAPFTVDAGGAAMFSDVVDVNTELTVIGRGTAFRRGRDGSTDVVFESSITSTSGTGELNIRVDGDPTDGIEFNNRTRGGQVDHIGSIATVRLEGDVDGLAILRLNVVPRGDGVLDVDGVPVRTRARENPFSVDRVPIAATIVLGPESAQNLAQIGDLSIDVGQFIVGFHEILTANTNLSLSADIITIGDTNVLGTLRLGPRAGGPDLVLNMLTRPRGSRFILPDLAIVPNSEADLVVAGYLANDIDPADTTFDRFVGGNSMFFTGGLGEVNVLALGPDDTRIFRTALPRGLGSIRAGDALTTFDDAIQIVQPLEAIGRSDFFLQQAGTATEIEGIRGGAAGQVANAAVFAAVVAAAESLVDVPAVSSVPTIDDDPLRDIKIVLRNLDGRELINSLIGRALYVDLPLDPSSGSGTGIAADRLSYRQIGALRTQMEKVLPGGDREGFIRDAISGAAKAFEGQGTSVIEAPEAFVQYVYSSPAQVDLASALGEVRIFVDLLRTGLAGLTPGELARAEDALFREHLLPQRSLTVKIIRMLVAGPDESEIPEPEAPGEDSSDEPEVADDGA